ncbi:glycosyltransferase family 4 protein [Candidatus Manganitrophus noduliformans]|uniref:Glycosyltransferase family 4 protein n=1 Tax=Candidatus Manganitrophus noduliformans TaxID=2606439 RepID=A0A7X6IC43_9BACT|nr:glycosyltransferase family 4 protein [Candidatus Manganitrophus noduliformans]NKE72293.1 glycosyltransferase family 4 protein [Candidatus Manganitrophus noduliformans]
MKIAQISPLFESVPPKLYGGTERVVSVLTEGLIKNGHDVTLFASGDSKTSARLVSVCRAALRLSNVKDPYADHILQLSTVYDHAEEFDLIHSHADYFTFPFAQRSATPTVTTLHGRLDMPELQGIHRYYKSHPLISISHSQRTPFPFANWVSTVHHGLPMEKYRFHPEPGSYLAFLGRIAPEKRADIAVAVAQKTGIPLKIAAKIADQDRDYFDAVIRPLIKPPLVEYIGEIGDEEKNVFLGDALALLFPIDWPEPFGLVMIESLACGTPVIARPYGSVNEILVHGTTGFIHSEVDDLVRAVERIGEISRKGCREYVEDAFSAERMVRRYEQAYEEVIAFWNRPLSADELAEAA